MNMKPIFAIACGVVALALSGCHYDEAYYPARSYYGDSSQVRAYDLGYYGNPDHGDCYDEHRAAHHAEHDYYDHAY